MSVTAVGLAPAAALHEVGDRPRATRRSAIPNPGPHPNLRATRSPRPSPGPSPQPRPLAHAFQGDFLKEADEDVGKIAAVLEATPPNMQTSLQQAPNPNPNPNPT